MSEAVSAPLHTDICTEISNASSCFELSINASQVAHLVMKRGDKLNTMTKAFWGELPDIIRQIDKGALARVIVLSSTGRHFSAGMDLGNFSNAGSPFTHDGKELDHARRADLVFRNTMQLQDSLSALEQCRIPVIAAIQGGCIGGAVDLATACDLRYATQDAWFCVQETAIGIVADVGTLQRLPKLIPDGIARELAFTGDRLPAQRALELGLLSAVAETQSELMEQVEQVAERIAQHSPLVTSGVKQVMNYSRDHSVSEGLEHVALWNASMLSSVDLTAAMTAYSNKKQASFNGLGVKKDYWET